MEKFLGMLPFIFIYIYFIIKLKEWNDYYAAVSASIDDDGHFVELMKIAWKLD